MATALNSDEMSAPPAILDHSQMTKTRAWMATYQGPKKVELALSN